MQASLENSPQEKNARKHGKRLQRKYPRKNKKNAAKDLKKEERFHLVMVLQTKLVLMMSWIYAHHHHQTHLHHHLHLRLSIHLHLQPLLHLVHHLSCHSLRPGISAV